MKKLTALVFTFGAMSMFGQNMQEYLKETQELTKSGKYQEALEHCIWFHDHVLEKDYAMRGVRLSFALSDWKSLADVYPPALTAMMDIRDKKTKQVLEGKGEPSNVFQDVVALNRYLGTPDKSIELFDAVSKANPTAAKKDWNYVKGALFEAKRYDLIKNFIGNPMFEYSAIVEVYNQKSYNENRFVEQCLQLIDYAMTMNDEKSAKEIQQNALTLVDDCPLRNAIPK